MGVEGGSKGAAGGGEKSRMMGSNSGNGAHLRPVSCAPPPARVHIPRARAGGRRLDLFPALHPPVFILLINAGMQGCRGYPPARSFGVLMFTARITTLVVIRLP